jgi:hypothetical protein
MNPYIVVTIKRRELFELHEWLDQHCKGWHYYGKNHARIKRDNEDLIKTAIEIGTGDRPALVNIYPLPSDQHMLLKLCWPDVVIKNDGYLRGLDSRRL